MSTTGGGVFQLRLPLPIRQVRCLHISQGTREEILLAHHLDKVGSAPILCLTKQNAQSLPTPLERHIPESPMANPIADEILESYCTDSRVHALINDPTTEGIDEG